MQESHGFAFGVVHPLLGAFLFFTLTIVVLFWGSQSMDAASTPSLSTASVSPLRI